MIQLVMVKSCTRSQASIALIIISPTSVWKKVSSKCCLTMLSGMVNLTTNTSTSVIGCFKTSSPMIISNMKTGLGTCLV